MKSRLFAVPFFVVCLNLLLFASASSAQFSGNIAGVVTDPSGGTISGAKVVLTNTATQISATTTTDQTGNFRFLTPPRRATR